MADSTANTASSGAAKSKKRAGGGRSTLLLCLMLLGAIMLFRPSVSLVLAVGMAPSLVALFTEVGMLRALRMRTIFLFNMAGALPFCVKHWQLDDLGAIVDDITGLSMVVTIYGTAMLGYFLLWLCPHIAAAVVQSGNREKLSRIDGLQQDLRREWGPGVTDEEES